MQSIIHGHSGEMGAEIFDHSMCSSEIEEIKLKKTADSAGRLAEITGWSLRNNIFPEKGCLALREASLRFVSCSFESN